jgi:hypothetical protein
LRAAALARTFSAHCISAASRSARPLPSRLVRTCRSPQSLHCISAASRSARPLPRGFSGHVAHPSRSIVSRLLPAALDRYLAASPDMSLTPVAPFTTQRIAGKANPSGRGKTAAMSGKIWSRSNVGCAKKCSRKKQPRKVTLTTSQNWSDQSKAAQENQLPCGRLRHDRREGGDLFGGKNAVV